MTIRPHDQVHGLGVCVSCEFTFDVSTTSQYSRIALVRYSRTNAWHVCRYGIAGLCDDQWYGITFSDASSHLKRLMNTFDEQMIKSGGLRDMWSSYLHADIVNYKRLLDMYRERATC